MPQPGYATDYIILYSDDIPRAEIGIPSYKNSSYGAGHDRALKPSGWRDRPTLEVASSMPAESQKLT